MEIRELKESMLFVCPLRYHSYWEDRMLKGLQFCLCKEEIVAGGSMYYGNDRD